MKKKAFTLIELLVVVAIIALLISILLPSLSRAREITKRAVCASNARGIGQGFKIYSNDNEDWFPATPFTEGTGNQYQTGVSFVGQMASTMTSITSGNLLTSQHPSRSMFLLVIDGTTTAKSFVCPSSGDTEDDLRNVQGSTQVAAQPGVNRFDFRGYPYVSYGYHLPYGQKARPTENLDPRMVLVADKGPYFQADGNAVGDSTGFATKDGAVSGLTAPSGADFTDAATILKLDNEKWRNYNSRSHGTEGQNALYQDGHASFERRPIIGVNFDNIYTFHGESTNNYQLKDTLVGVVPKNLRGPYVNTDSVIVP